MDPLVHVRNLTITFGELHAVNDASFALYPGQLLGLLGPNGAGKSTLLRAMAGLQPATAGSIHVMGQHLADLASAPRAFIGFAPDSLLIYPDLAVETFLQFVGRSYNLSETETNEAVGFWLDKLWLADKRTTRIRTLSKGMMQRLTIARALLPDPTVVLLDEPAAGLDPAGRVQFRNLLAMLRDQGKVLIVSSHILSDLQEYCTHIAIMSKGRMNRFCPIQQLADDLGVSNRRYRIELARARSDLADVLAQVPGLRVHQAAPTNALVDVGDSADHAADLLGQLVAAGLAVSQFSPVQANLEEAYLRAGIGQVE